MAAYYDIFTQSFPPAAELTEENIEDQSGKVFAITGTSAGVGYELARILYTAGGTVYGFNRSEEKTLKAFEAIKKAVKTPTNGSLEYIHCDLADLESIPPAVTELKKKTTRLDVLFQNAATSLTPHTDTSKQGHEVILGTNCIGPFLLARLLTPLLESTVKLTPASSVRIVWTTSIVVDLYANPQGVVMEELTSPPEPYRSRYTTTKVGHWYFASEYHRRYGHKSGVVSVAINPGNLRTQLLRNASWLMKLAVHPVCYPQVNGAYTNLWGGLSKEVELKDGGRFIIPFGRWHPSPNAEIGAGLKSKDEGGTGRAAEFWDWCEEQVKAQLK